MIKKPIEKLTPAQRKVRRALKRKNGPSGKRRAERRLHLQPKPVVESSEASVDVKA